LNGDEQFLMGEEQFSIKGSQCIIHGLNPTSYCSEKHYKKEGEPKK